MQHDLQISEERLSSIVTGAPVILFALDKNGIYTVSEGQLLSALGLKPGEAVGHSFVEVFPDAEDFHEEVLRALSGETFVSVSMGQGVALETRYSPMLDANGALIGTLGVSVDVTSRIEAERETLQRTLEKERDLKELKNRFISLVAHLFRTPLSVINTTSYLLENYHDKLDAEKRKDYFLKIRSQIDRVDDLIENILLVSEKEENGLPFNPTRINLEVFCRDLVAEVQRTVQPLHTLIFSCSGDLSSIAADEKGLRHIVSALLSNAIQYSPDGGKVIFNLTRQGNEAIFEVHDSGIGILPYDQPHLYEPFYRGKNTTGIKGGGLGLNIAKDFVDLHGGTIDFVSEPGNGTTFTVRLPIL